MDILRLINDQALGEGKPTTSDGLGFGTYAKILSEASIRTPGPFTIGIYGEWGSGKTSLMRLVESGLQGHKEVVTVWFNAWKYEKEEHPLIPLIGTIIHSLEQNRTFFERTADGGKSLITALRAIAYGFAAKSTISIPGLAEFEASLVAKDMIDREEKLLADPLLDRSLYYSAFEALADIHLSGDKRIVIIIDDLDRCFPDQAIKLLESIKLVLSQPNFIFIIGVARSLIEGYIQHRYETEYGIKEFQGFLYLDKLVQLPFYIPPHTERMKGFSAYLLSSLEQPIQEKLANILPIIAIVLESNPRAVVRFVNNLLVDISINTVLFEQNAMSQIDVEYFAISRCLQQRWLQVFVQLLASDELCNEVTRWKWDDVPDFVKSDKPEYVSLAKTFISNKPLFQLLVETKQGIDWLTNFSVRNSAVHFLQTQRRDPYAGSMPVEKVYAIHLSYASEDVESAGDITDILIRNGISVNMDEDFRPEASRSVGICIGLGSQGTELLKRHIEKALRTHQNDKSFLIVPILLPGVTRDRIPDSIKQFSYLDLKGGINASLLSSLIRQLKVLSNI